MTNMNPQSVLIINEFLGNRYSRTDFTLEDVLNRQFCEAMANRMKRGVAVCRRQYIVVREGKELRDLFCRDFYFSGFERVEERIIELIEETPCKKKN